MLLCFGVWLGRYGPGCTVEVGSAVSVHCGQAVDFSAFLFGFGARVLPDSEVRFPLWPRAIRTGGYVRAVEVIGVEFTQQPRVFDAAAKVAFALGGAQRRTPL